MFSMTIENIKIEETIERVRVLLAAEKNISPALKAAIEVIILALTLVCNRLGINSSNSSKSPSQDPNRKKGKKRNGKKPGGQNGHTGKSLEKVDDPDETIEHKIAGCERCNEDLSFQETEGYETRQVFDVEIKKIVIEHKAEIKTCGGCGSVNIGKFPREVSKSVQYGSGVKSLSTYMSLYQLIPYKRVEDFFSDQIGLPISSGSIFNFNMEAYIRLQEFETQVKERLLNSPLNHCDETGININGGKAWLHSVSNSKWTYFYPHLRRGSEAMDEMGILPRYGGVLCHDHWKPYYIYDCTHALCNAHHLRELELAYEQDKQQWAKLMKDLLVEINKKVNKSGGELLGIEIKRYQRRYRAILTKGEKECPLPEKVKGKRGRLKKSKSRNLLERLRDYEEDALRFMKVQFVPFTNNQAENDIRMTKVQQKISGCFRSMDGAKIFCRVRSYLSTARKNSVSSLQALRMLFIGTLPIFAE